MKIYWVPCGRNSSSSFPPIVWNFSDVLCMEWRCAYGLYIILWLFFLIFFCFVNLGLFSAWNDIKVFRQWLPCGHNSSYSFPLIVLKHCRCFQHRMKLCLWFWYNTLIIFSHFFCFVNLVSFFTWNAIKVCRQWLPCRHNSSYSFPPIVWKHCRHWLFFLTLFA